jgi:hypothetical protein
MADAVGNAAARSLIEGTDFGDNIKAALPSVLGNAIAGGFFPGDGGAGASEDNGGNLIDKFADGLLAGAGNAFQGISSAVAGAATATGDWLGFDGKFGYDGKDGPTGNGRQFSYSGPSDAIRGGVSKSANPAAQVVVVRKDANNFTGPTSRDNDMATALAAIGSDEVVSFDTNFEIDFPPGADDGLISDSFTFKNAAFEPYDDIFGQATPFQKMLMGHEAHTLLSQIARSDENRANGWWSERSIVNNRVDGTQIRFIGRADLGFSSLALNYVYELKPDTARAIELGELQVKGYVYSQRDTRNRLGETYDIITPYQVGKTAPWNLGFVGILPGQYYTGSYTGNLYSFRFAGNGVIAYRVSSPMQPTPQQPPVNVPNFAPFPLGRRFRPL